MILTKQKNGMRRHSGLSPILTNLFMQALMWVAMKLGLQPEEAVKGTNVSVFWGVDDIQSEYKRFLSLGATADEAPQNVGGEIMVATIKDPWNNIIGLIYNPEFKLP
jgi:hypothetical protein